MLTGPATARSRLDPVLLGLAVVVCGAFAVFAANRLPALTLGRLCWVLTASLETGACWYARRTARSLPVGDPARRFWRAFSFATLAVAAGYVCQLVLTATGPVAPELLLGAPVMIALTSIGVLTLLVVMCLHPIGLTSRRDRWCFLLDLATVLVAASVFGWYFTEPSAGLVATLSLPGLTLVAVFAATKLLIAGGPPFSRSAGLLGLAGATVGGVMGALGPGLLADGRISWFYAGSVLSDALLMACARVQSKQVLAGPEAPRPRRRPYSTLPYVAVGATFALLGSALWRLDIGERTWVVLVGAALSTGLVIIRQVVSFEDNARLLGELQRTDSVLRSALDERDALAVQLRELAYHDALTGLANRALFNDRLTAALARARRRQCDVIVMLLDLDSFKRINDDHGHAAGDAVLRATGAGLRSCLRESDTVARLGGDEFGIVIESPLPVDLDGLRGRLEAAVRRPVGFGDHCLTVGISVGVVRSVDGAGELDALLQQADAAMYAAKRHDRRTAAEAPR